MDREKGKKSKKYTIQIIIMVSLLVMVVIGFLCMNYSKYDDKVKAYNEAVSDYNIVAQEYINCIQNTSVDNIAGMPTELTYEKEKKVNLSSYLKNVLTFLRNDKVMKERHEVENKTKDLVLNYIIAQQITNPTSEWIKDRLEEIETIIGTQLVTEECDPNGLLGKTGGYTGCIYFSVSRINQNDIKGTDIVAKGTDCGGCIEVYENSEDAMVRCEYLSQFDNTLLYSGSYAVVGTMVVRTSYILTNEQQAELTNRITEVLTKIE